MANWQSAPLNGQPRAMGGVLKGRGIDFSKYKNLAVYCAVIADIAVDTRNWGDYPILRFPDVPAVQVELINRPDERPLGVGEGSQGPAVAAIANAFAHATGKRLRDLPLTPERVKQALA